MGFLDRMLSPVGDYMVQNQTFMPDTVEVVPAGDRFAILAYDEHGDRRVLGTKRTKAKAEAFAESIRQNNSPSSRAPKPKPKPFRET